MKLEVTIIGRNPKVENEWVDEVRPKLASLDQVVVNEWGGRQEIGKIVFLDAQVKNLRNRLESFDKRGRAIFLVLEEGDDWPGPLLAEGVDDVLVRPFRDLEVLGKVHQYRQVLLWEEVQSMNASFSEVLEHLHDDLKLAERLQKRRLPKRFENVKGFEVRSRYLAGMKSGGDYFDLAEAKDGKNMSIVLSDASSYGLSSAFLGTLMSVAIRLSKDSVISARDTVKAILGELSTVLGERDQLSLLYGVVSRRDYRFRYINLGSARIFRAHENSDFEILPHQGSAIESKTADDVRWEEGEVALQPKDRLVLVSDGFIEEFGGADAVAKFLSDQRMDEATDTLNEFAYQVKSKLDEPDGYPNQDCTAVILDVDERIIRVAG